MAAGSSSSRWGAPTEAERRQFLARLSVGGADEGADLDGIDIELLHRRADGLAKGGDPKLPGRARSLADHRQ